MHARESFISELHGAVKKYSAREEEKVNFCQYHTKNAMFVM